MIRDFIFGFYNMIMGFFDDVEYNIKNTVTKQKSKERLQVEKIIAMYDCESKISYDLIKHILNDNDDIVYLSTYICRLFDNVEKFNRYGSVSISNETSLSHCCARLQERGYMTGKTRNKIELTPSHGWSIYREYLSERYKLGDDFLKRGMI